MLAPDLGWTLKIATIGGILAEFNRHHSNNKPPSLRPLLLIPYFIVAVPALIGG